MPKPTTMLYDDIHRWSFGKPSESHVMVPAPASGFPALEQHLRGYRALIRRAERFYIDDDFLSLALKTSRDIKKMERYVNLARLPFDEVWFEWDCHAKVRISHEDGTLAFPLDLDQVPPRAGFLLKCVDQDTGTWVGFEFADRVEGGKVMPPSPFPVAWILAPEGPSVTAVRPPQNLQTLANVFGESAFPKGVETIGIGAMAERGSERFVYTPWVENRVNICVEPMTLTAYQEVIRRAEQSHRRDIVQDTFRATTHGILYSIQEEAGIIRFLIAVLAMLNNAPNVKVIHAASPGVRMKGMHKVPYLGHNTIHLELPKRKPVVHLHRILGKASEDRRRNRAHKVRGHFRQIEYGKKLPFKCDHEPTMVENGVGICLRCERMIRWIDPQVRGDSSLGWVNHDYVLEAS